jgi:hypothetical protein
MASADKDTCRTRISALAARATVTNHLQGMLVERQQLVPLHRHGATGNRMGAEHASDSGRALCPALGIANPPLLISAP